MLHKHNLISQRRINDASVNDQAEDNPNPGKKIFPQRRKDAKAKMNTQ
jgi:hypothetical protein